MLILIVRLARRTADGQYYSILFIHCHCAGVGARGRTCVAAICGRRCQRRGASARATPLAALASLRAESDRVALQSVVQAVDLVEVESEFGKEYLEYLKEQSVVLFEKELLRIENDVMHITEKGTFLSDGIAADLFYID